MEIKIALLMVIILFVCSLVTRIKNKIFEDKNFTRIMLDVIIAYSMIAMLLMIAYIISKPKAIDVYQNKTTLEITYKNNVPTDTVIVWKNK